MQEDLGKKIGNATKWSSITEISAKLVAPISSMVLARLLTPEAFGVVATINIIISFADMFTDAGFQKYLIQHRFKSEEDRFQSVTVAFWTNLFFSLLLWGIIAVFRDQIATLVGNPGLGNVIVIACVTLPMTSFSSIQMALFKRDFEFKILFYARLVGVLIPLCVTVPLAFMLRSYWALIGGTIALNLSNAIILTVQSKWKPNFYFSFKKLNEMFSFSVWTLFEQITIWLTTYIGTFIVGTYLNSYYVGLYKTSMTTVNQFTTLITTATISVLFSALSRLQNDSEGFKKVFFQFQRWVSILVMPMSLGMFIYRDSITALLLGSQWTEASMFVGLWGLTSSMGILLNNFCSEAYRALGKPKVSFAAQILHLVVLVPALIYASKIGFEALYWTRSLMRFQHYAVQLIFLYVVTRISFIQILKNIYPAIISACIMAALGIFLQALSSNIVWSFISIIICALFYFAVIMLFPQMRAELMPRILRIVDRLKYKLGRDK